MSKFCPIGFANGHAYCNTQCALYQGGCLIAKALDIYIKNNVPLTVKQPTEKEMNKFIEMIDKELNHPKLNVEHDYDEHGVDWYPHGYDDIAP